MLIAIATAMSVNVAVDRSRDRRRDEGEQHGADEDRDQVGDLDGRDAAVVWPSAQICSQSDSSSPPVPPTARRTPAVPRPSSVPRPARSAASPPTRSMSRSRNVGDVRLDGDIEVRRPALSRRQSVTVSPAVSSPASLDVHGTGLGPTSDAVERRRHRQRVVDERAVEPVVAGCGTPCRSAAHRRRSARSGCRRPSRRAASGPRRGPARSSRRACCRHAGRAGRRGRAGSAPSRSRRARAQAGAGSPVRHGAPTTPRTTILAASGSQWMFHSVVGRRVAGDPVGAAHEHPATEQPRQVRLASSAMARLVSGPRVTRVTSPGRRRASRR